MFLRLVSHCNLQDKEGEEYNLIQDPYIGVSGIKRKHKAILDHIGADYDRSE